MALSRCLTLRVLAIAGNLPGLDDKRGISTINGGAATPIFPMTTCGAGSQTRFASSLMRRREQSIKVAAFVLLVVYDKSIPLTEIGFSKLCRESQAPDSPIFISLILWRSTRSSSPQIGEHGISVAANRRKPHAFSRDYRCYSQFANRECRIEACL